MYNSPSKLSVVDVNADVVDVVDVVDGDGDSSSTESNLNLFEVQGSKIRFLLLLP